MQKNVAVIMKTNEKAFPALNMGIEKSPLQSAMLLIPQTVVFLGILCQLCSINIIRPYHNNKASIFIAIAASLLCSLQCLAVTRNQTGMYQLVMTL